MPLEEDWYMRPDVEKFVRILMDLGYECDIIEENGKATLRLWKSKTSVKVHVRR